jgi:hypothetical protein
MANELGSPTKRNRMFGRNMSKHMTDLGMLGEMPMINISGGMEAVPEIVSPSKSPRKISAHTPNPNFRRIEEVESPVKSPRKKHFQTPGPMLSGNGLHQHE